jgi:tripartite ATP-independent transporter DctM subunit
MDWLVGGPLAGVGFAAMLLLIALRVPVALAMFACGAVGYVWQLGTAPLLAYVKAAPFALFSSYALSVIPLFVLMGQLAAKAGLSEALFGALRAWLGHRRGGVAMAVIVACAGFGAVCGSAIATTATIGHAALPALRDQGYAGGLATATIAVGGTLGILIPPSVILVIYGIVTETNIANLFKAALLPGLLAAALHCLVIALVVRRRPQDGPAGLRADARARRAALRAVWPVLLIFLVVVGGIYLGVFTPTEGAAVGVVTTGLLAALRGGLSPRRLGEALLETAQLTGMIFALLLGADMFNTFLALTRAPETLATAVAAAELAPLAVIAMILAFYVLLGALMDELAMILLTLPVVFPVVMALDLGLPASDAAVWFGILVLVVVGIGLATPPIGLNVFVVGALARDVPLPRIYQSVLPFILGDLVRLALLVAFPGISLALVHLLR